MRRIAVVVAFVCALAAPATASAADYVAMGDSYASGTGTRSYTLSSGCQRGTLAYPYLMQASFGSLSFVACSGATTQTVLNNQVSALDAGTDYVTISVGGNDAGFGDVISACAAPQLPFTQGCNDDIDDAQAYIANTLPGRLNLVYAQIKQRAPNAVVAVVGYPRLFNGQSDCNLLTAFSSSDQSRLNTTADQLASVTRARAQAHGFTFVDSRGAFRGHAVCDSQEWLNGLSNPVGESYHPNATGHSAGYQPITRIALQAAPKPTAPVGGNGRIAFASTRDGNSEVYVINGNGQFPVNLTEHSSSDIDPSWSPDGTKVAFASNRDGDNEIYVMNGDGTGVTKLTNNSSDDREPTWSPNGALIAFRSDRTGNNEIFRMTATGGSQTNITNNSASDFAPDWSPDGSEVLYQRFTSGSSTGQGNEVFKANADGQGQTNMTNTAAATNDGKPAWAPNGSTFAFHSNRSGTDFEIHTMPALGGTVTQRTNNTTDDEDPGYSPNGASIAFQGERDGSAEIYTMGSDGSGQTRRTDAAGTNTAPSWQADSTPPATTITEGPGGPVADARPEFAFGSNELGSALQCRIDNAAYATCTSPFRPSANLAEGEHTFSVRATDPTGNLDTSPATRTFVVDTVKPEIELTCPPSALLNSDASATVDATDATSGIGQADDPTGDHDLDTSEPGRQRFAVQAIDLAGNVASAECFYDVLYAAPGTPALTDGDSPNAGDFAVGWDEAAAASYGLSYALERRAAAGGDWQQVDGGINGTSFAFERGESADEGTWVYRVRGIDSARSLKTPSSDESESVKVDQTAPAAPSLSADRTPEYAGDGGWFADSVEVTTSDNGDPELRDGSQPSGVDPASIAGKQTLDATDSLTRTVRDRVGNESAAATETFQVDSTRPELALECPESAPLLSDASGAVTASDAGSGLDQDPSGTVAIDTDSVGTKVIERTATDNVGHSRTERCEVLVYYPDPGAPAVTAGGNPNAGDFTIGWERSAPADYPVRYTLERRASGGDWEPVADGIDGDEYEFDRGNNADEGTWTYRVKGVDADNEVETGWSAASAPVVVDQTAPAAPTISADRAPEYAGDGGWFRDSVTATTTDNGDPDLRDGSESTGVDPASVAGPHELEESGTVRRTVRDRVGNESAEAALALQVDPKRPELALECPDDVVLGGDAVVKTTASDEHSGLDTDPSGTVDVDTSEVGTQIFERTATDNVGHSRTERCEVLVRYDYRGLEQPIQRDRANVFDRGDTIPLKLALLDADGKPVAGAELRVDMERMSADGEDVVDVVAGTAANGKPFTYSAERYRFNLSTVPLAAGDWRIRITLDDGTVHRTAITLR